jgi:hypothetical protein
MRLRGHRRPNQTVPGRQQEVTARQPAAGGTVTIKLSPGLAAYSFTFG